MTTLNARYPHSSFGLRYLFANLKELQSEAAIAEFTLQQSPRDVAEAILRRKPELVGFGVYIWNTRQTQDVISILKKVRPGLLIVLGGPEVSHETESQAICQLADYVFRGEADFLFHQFCRDWVEKGILPDGKIVSGPLPEIRDIALPYRYYTDEDIRHRVIYVEASRGCPYKCEYCLSSLDKSVRSFDLDRFLEEMENLIRRGARQFKFVDRTFNLSVSAGARILRFFLERIELGLFLHFEMVPDRLPEELRELIRRFPEGSLQFEIGIQTWNAEVASRVSRRQDYQKIRENFAYLTEQTGAHLHADLIVGLPGEDLGSFGEGFDAVFALGPDEIQVGILKRLKGTPIVRHDREWEMVYQAEPPFQILSNRSVSFEELQAMGRFARFWDLIANSGNFRETLLLLRDKAEGDSFFRVFHRFSEFLGMRHPQGHGVALLSLVESTWIYLTEHLAMDHEPVREGLARDYTRGTKRDLPRFLRSGESREASPSPACQAPPRSLKSSLPPRQARHASIQSNITSTS